MIGDFLRSHGFNVVSDTRERHGQTILATRETGMTLTIRVRLCWVREGEGRARTYSAAQIIGKIKDDDPEGSVREKIEREISRGVTHFLFVQREGDRIVHAALVPLSELLTVWCAQRDKYDILISAGELGRSRKNPAINGSSPTLYLQNDNALQVTDILWSHPGVVDLPQLRQTISVRLTDEEADVDVQNGDNSYIRQDGDWRHLVERQIKERRGQQSFRQALCSRYNNRCLITNCELLAVIEAAHINPYRGENDNHPENGLLLRADIHTLFDLNLIGVEPQSLQVILHPTIQYEYGELAGRTLNCEQSQRPSEEALKLRYEEFQRVKTNFNDLRS